MNRKTLLKVVSVLFLIWAGVNLLSILGINSCAGLTTGVLFGSVSAGFALATVFQISRVVCVVFMLIAGIAGVQAKNRSLCNVCGIIILISAIITFLGNVGGDWSLDSIISALISVALPVLYYIGVRKAFGRAPAAAHTALSMKTAALDGRPLMQPRFFSFSIRR